MRLVLDTNVIISALLFDGQPERLLLTSLSDKHQLILSSYIIAETSRILDNKFRTQADDIVLLQQFLNNSELIYFEPFLHIIADEPDNRILETAIVGKVDYLVTGDKLLLGLKSHQDIQIITVGECLRLMV